MFLESADYYSAPAMEYVMITIGIVDGVGHTGVELSPLLVEHSAVELSALTSRDEAGMSFAGMLASLLETEGLWRLPVRP